LREITGGSDCCVWEGWNKQLSAYLLHVLAASLVLTGRRHDGACVKNKKTEHRMHHAGKERQWSNRNIVLATVKGPVAVDGKWLERLGPDRRTVWRESRTFIYFTCTRQHFMVRAIDQALDMFMARMLRDILAMSILQEYEARLPYRIPSVRANTGRNRPRTPRQRDGQDPSRRQRARR